MLGPKEADRVWPRHIDNSLAIENLIPADHTVADLGSGAGLPGIPLAIVRPDLRLTLVEPLLRRSVFLDDVVDELGLGDRVAVVRARAEDREMSGRRFDTVTSRALAPLTRLINWSWPLVAPGGQVVALKGRSAADELQAEAARLRRDRLVGRVVECPTPGSDEPTYAVVIHSTAPRPPQAEPGSVR